MPSIISFLLGLILLVVPVAGGAHQERPHFARPRSGGTRLPAVRSDTARRAAPHPTQAWGCVSCKEGCVDCLRWSPEHASYIIQGMIEKGDLSGAELRDEIVTYGLKGFINLKDNTTGLLPLRSAIDLSRTEYVKVLLNLGADANGIDDQGAVVNAAWQTVEPESVEIMRMLLRAGARVDAVTRRSMMNMTSPSPFSNCKRYFISRSEHCFGFNGDRVEALGVGMVKRLTLGVVGQPLALSWLLKAVFGHLCRIRDPQHRTPLVLVFAGKPGHGKTQTAEILATLKLAGQSTDFVKINCNTQRHMGDFLGHGSTYIGSNKDTPLNTFLMAHDNRPGVVILDEADKLQAESWMALMTIFDRGVWDGRIKGMYSQDDGDGSPAFLPVNCRRLVFVLTANFLDRDVAAFEGRHRERLTEAAHSAEHGIHTPTQGLLQDEFLEFIRPKFQGQFGGNLGDAISRRIDSFVPFFSFSPLERLVLAELAFSGVATALKVPQDTYPVSNISLVCNMGAMSTFAEAYRISGGVTCIKRAIEQAVRDELPSMYAQEDILAPSDRPMQATPDGKAKLYLSRVKVDNRYRVVVTREPSPQEDNPSGSLWDSVKIGKGKGTDKRAWHERRPREEGGEEDAEAEQTSRRRQPLFALKDMESSSTMDEEAGKAKVG